MDHTTVSTNLKKGKFLGSKDRIILSGNNPTTNLQIQYSKFVNGVEGKRQFKNMSEVSLGGNCVDMELCGIPRLTKTFAAVAKTHRGSGLGSISLVDVETNLNTAQLHAQDEKDYVLFDSFCPYTSLSFQPDQELLAAGTESGEIVIFDLYGGREVSRIRADPTGVNKLCFMQTGQLVSVGNSEKSQIKVWDLKMKNNTQSSGAISPKRSIKQTSESQFLCLSSEMSHSTRSSPNNSPVGRTGSSSPFSAKQHQQVQYTCMSPHPIHERIVCGTNTGSVVMWDLRNPSGCNMEFQPHQSRVTDVLIHPRQQDIILSSSADGTVKYFNNTNYAAAHILRGGAEEEDGAFTTLLSEPAAVNALDYDADSNMLIAVSAIGSMWRLQL